MVSTAATMTNFSVELQLSPQPAAANITDLQLLSHNVTTPDTLQSNHSVESEDWSSWPTLAPPRRGAGLLGVSRALLLYSLPPVLVLGSVGNVLCMVVLQRKAMQTTPSSTYLMCLVATDTVILYVSAAKTWVRLVWGFELLHVADALCRLVKYTFFTCTHLSAWLVVLLSLERFTVVSFPFRASSMLIVRRPRRLILGLVLVVMVINTNLLWASKLVEVGGGQACLLYSSESWVCRALPIINMLLYSLLPSLIILLTNAAIIVMVLRRPSRSMQPNHHSTQPPPPGEQSPCSPAITSASVSSAPVGRANSALNSRTQRRLTTTLLTICVSWLVLSAPYCLMDNVAALRSNVLARSVCYVLLYLNHALNFYIYCLTGKKFRHELLRACVCCQSLAQTKHHLVKCRQRNLTAGADKGARREAGARAHLYN